MSCILHAALTERMSSQRLRSADIDMFDIEHINRVCMADSMQRSRYTQPGTTAKWTSANAKDVNQCNGKCDEHDK